MRDARMVRVFSELLLEDRRRLERVAIGLVGALLDRANSTQLASTAYAAMFGLLISSIILLIFRPNGILYFANANRVHSRLRELVEAAGPSLRAVILNLETSPEIDVTCLEMLDRCRTELRESGIHLCFARIADPIRDLFKRSGFVDQEEGLLFRGVNSAVAAYLNTKPAASVAARLTAVVEHE